ncbi:electron transport complex protein RnfB [Solimonas aquatica]|uniref:Electron transport complex protein RnfB n=1 Tax=Solimonas aquatica TaxID=489703 RepID=A0A1H9KIN2_9GAMM|nr:RnfABCDGE type electron transport complex subunit B [Solimonas aquatica]SEQ98787.1 electron transport complex protein RnfB [Solimonas aquatica]
MSLPALIEQIDALLPQTQCTRCGYPACRPYAEAIASGQAEINQCPPGGEAGVQALASLLQREALPLNPVNGLAITRRLLARIDEAVCIGCTKCIQACPTDAILGAANLMHTVIAEECSGCELCIPPCPVDCISMVDVGEALPVEQTAPQYRQRYEARAARLQRWEDEARAEREARLRNLADPVARALAAAQAKRQNQSS